MTAADQTLADSLPAWLRVLWIAVCVAGIVAINGAVLFVLIGLAVYGRRWKREEATGDPDNA